jgi:hypothetical protein
MMPVSKWASVHTNYYFLTAWNEWNEQAVLEPSDKLGFGMLNALQHLLHHMNPRSIDIP